MCVLVEDPILDLTTVQCDETSPKCGSCSKKGLQILSSYSTKCEYNRPRPTVVQTTRVDLSAFADKSAALMRGPGKKPKIIEDDLESKTSLGDWEDPDSVFTDDDDAFAYEDTNIEPSEISDTDKVFTDITDETTCTPTAQSTVCSTHQLTNTPGSSYTTLETPATSSTSRIIPETTANATLLLPPDPKHISAGPTPTTADTLVDIDIEAWLSHVSFPDLPEAYYSTLDPAFFNQPPSETPCNLQEQSPLFYDGITVDPRALQLALAPNIENERTNNVENTLENLLPPNTAYTIGRHSYNDLDPRFVYSPNQWDEFQSNNGYTSYDTQPYHGGDITTTLEAFLLPVRQDSYVAGAYTNFANDMNILAGPSAVFDKLSGSIYLLRLESTGMNA
ncbi:hypothetical protein B0H11DRAFT_1936652 [Mycena galericulata]|nr:hypothetical protein B0H11DRAFT_1936652 [Mycena galericulata]